MGTFLFAPFGSLGDTSLLNYFIVLFYILFFIEMTNVLRNNGGMNIINNNNYKLYLHKDVSLTEPKGAKRNVPIVPETSLYYYIFLFLFFLKKEGISKSFCDGFVSVLAGIELIFFSHVFDTILSTPILEIGSFFSNPVAITVI